MEAVRIGSGRSDVSAECRLKSNMPVAGSVLSACNVLKTRGRCND